MTINDHHDDHLSNHADQVRLKFGQAQWQQWGGGPEGMGSLVKFTPLCGARDDYPLCYLLEIDDAVSAPPSPAPTSPQACFSLSPPIPP